MVQVLGFNITALETKMEFLTPGFSLTQPQLVLVALLEVNQQMKDLALSQSVFPPSLSLFQINQFI